jgi:sigma-B regulation protein RsbU (phosphoserine phosphatase)
MKDEEKQSLSLRISFRMALIIMVVGALLIAVTYRCFDHYYIANCSRAAEQVVQTAASLVDGDTVGAYLVTGAKDSEYKRMQRQFNTLKSHVDNIEYLYLFVPGEDHFTYLLEAYRENEDMDNIADLGEIYEYKEPDFEIFLPYVEDGKVTTTHNYLRNDSGDIFGVGAWEPVFDHNGRLTAMIEADYYMSSLRQNIHRYMGLITLILAGILIMVFLIMQWIIRSQITNPLMRLMRHVNSYQDGTFQEPFTYEKKDEIRWLSDSFHDMDQRIHDYIDRLTVVTAEKERVGAELDMAKQIQASMLPNIFPPFPERPEFDIFASMTPAREVGGDFYDFFMVDDDHLALVIGDVSGKGVAAALFMVIAKTMLKNRAQLGESPKVILEKVNNQLCEGNDAELFVTVWIGIYEISTGCLTAANAGHEYPAICRKGGRFELYKDRHGFVLAGMEDMRYTEYELELEPGDVLMVYTDGVPEAVDGADQLFTTDRMLYSLDGADSRDPETLVKKLQLDVEHFTGDALQFDDITMLCFRRNR